MGHTTNWIPGIVALAIGLLGGLVLALRSRRASRAQVPEPEPEARDLEAERELLLGRLKEMSGADDEATARERYRLELAAAQVLLEEDRLDLATPARTEKPEGPRAAPTTGLAGWMHAHPRLQGAISGVGGTLAVVGLVLWVMNEAKVRTPGGSATGNGQAAMGATGGQDDGPDVEIEELQTFAKNHPDSIDTQLDLAEAYLQRDQPVPAFEAAQKVLQKDPDNARGLTYAGVVRMAMGQGDEAMKLLDRAVARDPNLAEAWVHRGLVASQVGNYQVAIDSWEKALKLRPDGESLIRPALEKVKEMARQGGMPAPGNLPPGHPPLGGGVAPASAVAAPAAAPAAQPQAQGDGVHGTLELDPALAGTVHAGATIFVLARPDGVNAGPPSAARRLTAGTFPLEFTLGPQDSMMGLPWPEKATIEARVDSDGNAMTRDPADPVARQTGVTKGAAIKLVLKVAAPQ